MIRDLRAGQALYKPEKTVLQLCDGIRILQALVTHPRTVYRMYDKRSRILLSERKRIAEIVKVSVKIGKCELPWIMLRKMNRIVTLALSALGIRIQMLAHHIYAVYILYLGDASQLERGNIPSAAGKHLGYRLLLTELSANRTELLGRKVAREPSSKIIYAGNILIFVKRHNTAAAPHLSRKRSLLDGMAGYTAAVFLAPIVNRLYKIIYEHSVRKTIVVMAKLLCTVKINEERRQSIEHAVSVLTLESLGKQL